jgi:RNA polymerase primary sigma factor
MVTDFELVSDQDARIARAIESLRADFDRQGYVTDDQVVRAVQKRSIAAEGHLRVRQALLDAGINIEGLPEESRVESIDDLAKTSQDDAIRRYLVEIGKYRLLKPEDEVTLGRRIQAGRQALEALSHCNPVENDRPELLRLHRIGQDAEQQMILANLRLVVSVAKRFSKTFSLDLLDLIQEGTMGLMRAVERFDYQKGFKFSTYASWWIIQSITRSIADKDRLIRLPVHIIESLRKLQRLRRRLSASTFGAEPDPRELAVHLGWKLEKVRLLLSVADDVVSLDAPVGDSEESSLAGLLKSQATRDPEQLFASLEEKQLIDAVVAELGGKTAEIIRLRFGLGISEELTLQEIGAMKGVTRERIRQIESKGIRSLQRKSRALRHLWNDEPGLKTQAESSVAVEKQALEKQAPVSNQRRPPRTTSALVTLFDRLPSRSRKVLALRYGLNGGSGLSEQETSARLDLNLRSVREVEGSALNTLGHNSESFRCILEKSEALRDNLSAKARAARRGARQRQGEEEAVIE